MLNCSITLVILGVIDIFDANYLSLIYVWNLYWYISKESVDE
jgi:hypothetical protein